MILVGTVCTIGGALALALSPWQAPTLIGSLLIGAGVALSSPATRVVLLDAVAAAERRHAAATSFQMWNVGLGVGGLIGGQVADPRHPVTFTALFVALAGLGVATRILNLPAMPRGKPSQGRGPRTTLSPLVAVRTPAFARYLLIAVLLEFVGYGQSTSGVPGLATTLLRVSPGTIGVALAANTAIILLTGPFTRRFSQRHRSSTTLGIVALLWSGAWLLVLGATIASGSALSGSAIIAFYLVFGLGETLLAAVSTPLVATLAPPGALGTYIGLDTLTRQIGGAIGPALAGALIAARIVHGYPLLMFGVCIAAYPVTRLLQRALTVDQDTPFPRRPDSAAALSVGAGLPGRDESTGSTPLAPRVVRDGTAEE